MDADVQEKIKAVQEFERAVLDYYDAVNMKPKVSKRVIENYQRKTGKLLKLLLSRKPTQNEIDEILEN